MHKIIVNSPYYFGDVVDFHSRNGSGRGRILDIVISPEDIIYYIIERIDGLTYIGIYPQEIQLVKASDHDDPKSVWGVDSNLMPSEAPRTEAGLIGEEELRPHLRKKKS